MDSGEADHWYAHYQLGVMAHCRGDTDKALAEYRRSLAKQKSPWALRGLAFLEKEKTASLLLEAVQMKPIRPLVIEAMEAFLAAGQYDRILRIYRELPGALGGDGRVQTYYAAALLRSGNIDEAEQVLRSPIVLTDVREGNTLLTDLWFEAAAIRHAGKADEESLAWAETHARPPEHLDFRML